MAPHEKYQSKARSVVWRFYQRPNDSRAPTVQCPRCRIGLVYGGTTTGIKSHLKTHHNSILIKLNNELTSQRPDGGTSTKDGHTLLARALATGMVPLRFSKNPEFCEFVDYISNGSFKPMDGHKMMECVNMDAGKHLERLREMYRGVENFTVLTDGYTNLKRDFNFYSLHVSHTNDRFQRFIMFCGIEQVEKGDSITIASALCSMLQKVGLTISNCSAFATDAGSPLVAVAKTHHIDRVHCACHLLNLIIEEFARSKQVEKISMRAQEFARYLSRHKEDKTLLKSMAASAGITSPLPLPLPQTRWAGLFLLLSSYLDHFSSIKTVANMQKYVFKPEQMTTLAEIVKLLQPIYDGILKLEKDTSFSSEIIPTMIWIKSKCEKGASSLAKKMSEIVSKRLSVCYENKRLISTMIVDHRFAYSPSFMNKREWDSVEDQLSTYDNSQPTLIAQNSNMSSDETLEAFFEGSYQNSGTNADDLKTDLVKYRAYLETQRPQNRDPLEFWVSNCKNFPFIAPIAANLLSTPASSAVSERTFSRCTDFLRQPKRNRAKIEALNNLLTVSELCKIRRSGAVLDSESESETEDDFRVWRENEDFSDTNVTTFLNDNTEASCSYSQPSSSNEHSIDRRRDLLEDSTPSDEEIV